MLLRASQHGEVVSLVESEYESGVHPTTGTSHPVSEIKVARNYENSRASTVHLGPFYECWLPVGSRLLVLLP
jgi:hypothetical protein